MQFSNIVFFLLSLVAGCLALALPTEVVESNQSPSLRGISVALDQRAQAAPFSVANIYTNTFNGGEDTKQNRKISFHLLDSNFNSSVCCNTRWIESDTRSTVPTEWVNCDTTGKQERYRFKLENYRGLNTFTLQLAHAFRSSTLGPAPYDSIEYFAAADITLSCTEQGGNKGCYMPPGVTTFKALVHSAIA